MDPMSFLFDSSAACRRNMLFLGNTDHLIFGGESLRSSLGIEESLKRRPFFCQPDDMFGDEYYDDQSPEKKRRLSSEQVHMLEKTFEAENKLEPDRKLELAKKLGLQPRQVAIWFQNRRARWKTKQLERDYDLLKSLYDSLLVDYDSILRDNEKLRLEVTSLNEKLRTRETPQTENCADPAMEKVGDGFSSGSSGSTVANEGIPWHMGSPGSYYLHDDGDQIRHQLVDIMDAAKSEDYDSSGDDRSCFCGVFCDQQQQLEASGGWWDWP
ncbi:hypothetical protein SAY86_004368 [Trapa natans]|uniref:Homeobox-leucine zipper protein n=1 Tax=Trapa natans TaxID=22666 RepID=A0AAN7MIF4_TRANT|nr:hypothetical protein SAY86_004368 [Trapa natans]